MRVHAVHAYTKDYRVTLVVFGLINLKVVGFARTARGLVFGIKIEDYPLSAIVFQTHGGIFLGSQREIGRNVPSYRSSGTRAREQARNHEDNDQDHKDEHRDFQHSTLPEGIWLEIQERTIFPNTDVQHCRTLTCRPSPQQDFR